MIDMTARASCADAGIPLLGNRIIRMLYRGDHGTLTFNTLLARAKADATDFSALIDIALFLQATDQVSKGHEIQRAAVGMQPVYRRLFGKGTGLQIVALVNVADIMANTPVEYLLEGSDATLHYVYVNAETTRLPRLPPCDVIFIAVSESPTTRPVLANLERLLDGWTGPPIVNGALERIAKLNRENLHQALVNEPSILSPAMIRVARHSLIAMTAPAVGIGKSPTNAFLPIVIRPIGTHCGKDQERITSADELTAYLRSCDQGMFYMSGFVDYSRSDGLYRKMRVAVVQGVPYACHLAVSAHWKVHYLSADMHLHANRRDEEARWMETFDTDFAVRHAAAFAALTHCFGVEYYLVDCAETDDGRLLVFEADTMMIAHDLDPETLYPYKKPTMRKLFRAFQRMLADKTVSAGWSATVSAAA